jgi:curli biogenesis system outer membrane secretion channel CsgG
MKKLIIAAALAAAVTSPALAAVGSHSARAVNNAAAAQANSEEYLAATQPFAHNPSYDVYKNGEYVGSDPDPLVRLQIENEEMPGSK